MDLSDSQQAWRSRTRDAQQLARDMRRLKADSAGSMGSELAASCAGVLDFIESDAAREAEIANAIAALSRAAAQDATHMSELVDMLLKEMQSVLMLPFSSVMEVFPRMVRDLARDEGRQVAWNVTGEEIEVDRRVLEAIKDPLIHLVRNCVSHGIEKPDVRTARGKATEGRVSLHISALGSDKVEITLSDDGAGVDLEAVKSAAVKRGYVGRDEASRLDDLKALSLIFLSEVSTSPLITDLSGRGLGLAIAREKVEALGGSVSVLSRPPRHRVSVDAAADALHFPRRYRQRRGPETCHPNRERGEGSQSGSKSHRQSGKPRVHSVRRRHAVPPEPFRSARHGGECGRCSRLFSRRDPARVRNPGSLPRGGDPGGAGSPGQESREAAGPCAQHQRRHRPGRWRRGSHPERGGAVDVRLAWPAREAPSPAAQAPRARKKSRILVAEDSATSRVLLQSILQSAGYEVKTAVDGADAFASLRTELFDLLGLRRGHAPHERLRAHGEDSGRFKARRPARRAGDLAGFEGGQGEGRGGGGERVHRQEQLRPGQPPGDVGRLL